MKILHSSAVFIFENNSGKSKSALERKILNKISLTSHSADPTGGAVGMGLLANSGRHCFNSAANFSMF